MCKHSAFHPQAKVGRVTPDTDKMSTTAKPTRHSPPSQHDTRTKGVLVYVCVGGGGGGEGGGTGLHTPDLTVRVFFNFTVCTEPPCLQTRLEYELLAVMLW